MKPQRPSRSTRPSKEPDHWLVYREGRPRFYLTRSLFNGYEWTKNQRAALWFRSLDFALNTAATNFPGVSCVASLVRGKL